MTKTISLVHGNGGEENNELRDIFPRPRRLESVKELRKLKYPTSFSEPMACLRCESAWKPLLLGLLFSEGKPSLPNFEVFTAFGVLERKKYKTR